MANVHDVIPPFQLIQPTSLDEAVEAADAYGSARWRSAGHAKPAGVSRSGP